MSCRGPFKQQGFTLVEVMISITILSMIMLATVTALRTFGNTQHTLAQMTHRVDEVRSVSQFLRRALDAAVLGETNSGLTLGGGADGSSGFLGSQRAFQWKSVLVFGESYGGSFLLRVAQEEDRLMLRWLDTEVRRGREPDWSQSEAWPLIEGLQEFTVAYRMKRDGAWLPEWSNGSPRWVRVSIRARNRYWPDLIMQVPQ